MKSNLALFFILILITVGCTGQSTKNIETISSSAFAEKTKETSNPQILDVRNPEEFALDHIENATNTSWNAGDFIANTNKLDKSKPVFVYCKTGGRSAKAAAKLAEAGFSKIYNLDGGIMKWNAVGYGKTSDKIIGMCDQEYNELIKSDQKVLVDFYAEWCGPCKKMSPYILKMQEELKDKIAVIRIDADKNKTIVDYLKLDGLPVLILYENGKEIWRNVGYISEEDLKKHL